MLTAALRIVLEAALSWGWMIILVWGSQVLQLRT